MGHDYKAEFHRVLIKENLIELKPNERPARVIKFGICDLKSIFFIFLINYLSAIIVLPAATISF